VGLNNTVLLLLVIERRRRCRTENKTRFEFHEGKKSRPC